MTEKEELKLEHEDILTERWLRRHYGHGDAEINYLKAGGNIPTGIGNDYIRYITEGKHKGLFKRVRPEMSYGEMVRRYGPEVAGENYI
jgi:hypothetical protein